MDMDQILEQTLSANFESVLERLLEPIARIERLKRKESLTPEEVELVYAVILKFPKTGLCSDFPFDSG